MTSLSHGRSLAIAAAAIFTFGGLKILLGPALLDPDAWDDHHILTALIVAGTIGAGHLCGAAWLSRRFAASLAFAALFLSGTLLVVVKSITRQAEGSGTTLLATEDLNARISAKQSELADTKKRRAHSDAQADKEMTGERCASRCRAWRQNGDDLGKVIAALEADLAALGPQRPVNAGAEYLAEMAGFFGWQREQVISIYSLFTPLIATLFFELGSVISISYAFASKPSQAAIVSRAANDCQPIANGIANDTVAGNRSIAKVAVRGRCRQPLPVGNDHPVIAALASVGGSVASNQELAGLMRVTPGEATKRRREVADLIRVERVGKEARISIAA